MAKHARDRQRTWSCERLEPRQLLAAAPIITEFMAANSSTLADGYGRYADWIELYNAGDASVDLAGWHLTDDPADLAKWQFPSTSQSLLAPGEFLTVFASGDGLPDVAGNLHANFALAAAGEHLILADASLQIVSEFGRDGLEYPAQFDDVSFGTPQTSSSTTLVGAGSTVTAVVPPDERWGVAWTEQGFSFPGDVGAVAGTWGAGYDAAVGSGGSEPTAVLRLDFDDRSAPTTSEVDNPPGYESYRLTSTSGPTTRVFGEVAVTVAPYNHGGSGALDDRDRSAPTPQPPQLNLDQLYDDFIFSANTTTGTGLEVTLSGLLPGAAYDLRLRSYDMGSSGVRRSTWTEESSGESVVLAAPYEFDGTAPPISDDDYVISSQVVASPTGTLQIRGVREDGLSYGVFLNSLDLDLAPLADVIKLDFNDEFSSELGAADTEPGYQPFTLGDSGSTVAGVKVTLSSLGGAVLEDRDRSVPLDVSPSFTLDQIYDDFIFANDDVPSSGQGLEVLLENLTPGALYRLVLRSYDGGNSGGDRESVWTEVSGATPITLAANYVFNAASPPTSDGDATISAFVYASSEGSLRVRGVNANAERAVFLNALELQGGGQAGDFTPFIGTDLQEAMRGVNGSAYLRSTFELPPDTPLDQLTLDVQYDAGFVAYLNGQEVARRNAPTAAGTAPAFDAVAVAERNDADALTVEHINLTAWKNLLTDSGENVLAFHGLNSDAMDDDYLLLPTLSALGLDSATPRYFTESTPGALNGAGVLGFVERPQFSAERGFYDAPFQVTLTTATTGAAIYYTI
ncbi:MAG: lamin tail domain-containing protein, partial [Planctomycetales bacterium]|nr:lamin tail domain-containing protein [Planctomycetales bacterium]